MLPARRANSARQTVSTLDMMSAHFQTPKKTLHSVPFFVLLLAVPGGWFTLAYLAASYVMDTQGELISWFQASHAGLFYFAMLMLGILVFGPGLCLWVWMVPRVSLRADRIMSGEGWGGWTYVPLVSAPPTAQQTLLSKRRQHLYWQIPLLWLAGAGWSVLMGAHDGWSLGDESVAAIGKFLLTGSIEGLLIFNLPIWLIARSFPSIRKTVKGYFQSQYPHLVNKQKGRADEEDAPAADLTPQEQEDDEDNTFSALPDGMVRPTQDYAALLNRAHVSAQTRKAQKRQRSLQINLLWQTPGLALLAALFIAVGFDHALITPRDLLQGRDAVEIAIVEPFMFWVAVTLLPACLMALWVGAWNPRRTQWWERQVINLVRVGVVLLVCTLLVLPGQFLLMPWLGYQRCSCLEFGRISSLLPIPSAIRWLKSDPKRPDLCQRDLKFCSLL